MPVDSPFARLISDLGQILGIAGLAPSDEGICQMVFDGRHVVQAMHLPGNGLVLLSCRLSDHGVDAAQAERMARANFLQAGRGVVLCIGPDGRPCMQVAVDLSGCTADTLSRLLESLLDQAENWSWDAAPAKSSGGRPDPSFFLQSV